MEALGLINVLSGQSGRPVCVFCVAVTPAGRPPAFYLKTFRVRILGSKASAREETVWVQEGRGDRGMEKTTY